ncbi:MAG: hypothetical protein HYT11_00145 [Candidatus Levybacteria bacterium]|nr:hypothetical protein [Candidatus Levybacteria bacterium]
MSALQEIIPHNPGNHRIKRIKDLLPFHLNDQRSSSREKSKEFSVTKKKLIIPQKTHIPSDAMDFTPKQKKQLQTSHQRTTKHISSTDLHQRMSRREFGKMAALGTAGTLFVFSKILLDKGGNLINEGQTESKKSEAEKKKLLPNPLAKFSETDGVLFIIDEEILKHHVAGLPQGTSVTLSQRKIISQEKKDPPQQLLRLTSGEKDYNLFTSQLTRIKKNDADFIAFTSYDPYSKFEILYENDTPGGKNVEPISFTPDFINISLNTPDTVNVFVERGSGRSNSAYTARTRFDQAIDFAEKKLGTFKPGNLLILENWPEGVIGDSISMPGIGAAVPATIASLKRAEATDIVTKAMLDSIYEIQNASQNEGIKQYHDFHRLLSDYTAANPGTEKEKTITLGNDVTTTIWTHPNPFVTLDAIRGRGKQNPFIALPENFMNAKYVFKEVMAAYLLQTKRVLAYFDYNNKCAFGKITYESSYENRDNLKKLFARAFAILLAVEIKPDKVQALFSSRQEFNALKSSGFMDYKESARDENISIKIPPTATSSPTPGFTPTSTPTRTPTPTPIGTATPTPTYPPTLTPTAIPADVLIKECESWL